ncbi:hypothetical protein OPT61_g8336 [Boeremia exigua]|uniref:Uncharacterized protein n=1 Tax=Boeremia exigua TaxID=749465 RepID=A0ACC2HYW4_9PLEO|nr:hypothetical protein OPT61_g8336 [Boeremia exigua]
MSYETLFSLLVALLVAICYHILFWRTSQKAPTQETRTPEPPTTYQFTLRVSEVPLDTPHQSIEGELENVLRHDARPTNNTNVKVQLCRFSNHRQIAHGTATFATSLPKLAVIDKLQQGTEFRFDDKFDGITPLYEHVDGADVDIIAVPGLASHAFGSWKSPNNSDVWLRDFLPVDVPNTRQTERRPIIFIGHSLGGLLIKEALIHAHQQCHDSDYLNISRACYGMLFFGVPNLGLRNKQLMTIVKGQPNQSLVHDLLVDDDSEPSTFLKRISDQFSECCRNRYQVVSLFERQRSPTVQEQPDGSLAKTGPKMMMVTTKSATSTGLTATADEDNIPLNKDHSGLVKYESRNDAEYIIVREKVRSLAAKAGREVPKRFAIEDDLTPTQQRSWNDLNDPPYTAFRNSSKLAKPEAKTLQWLIDEECDESAPDRHRESTSEQTLCMTDFVTWRDSDTSQSLLIVAPPGRGKSVLSNFVLEHLESRSTEKSPVATKTIYYFCNIKNDEASRNARSVLQALIVQLCERQQRLFRLLHTDYEKKSDLFFSASFDTLWHIFERMLQDGAYNRIYCVIDGLDVYKDEMAEFISKLSATPNRHMSKNSPLLKLFCTSRPGVHLDKCSFGQRRILRCNPKDLDVFIHSRVSSLREDFTDNMKEMIKRQCHEQVDGTFLWLEVVIRDIGSLDFPNVESIQERFKQTSLNLEELYRSLIQDMVQKKIDIRLLAWVAYAQEPLSLKSLEDAMAIGTPEANTTLKERETKKSHLTARNVQRALGTLLDVIDDKVYLIHQSVKDFFVLENPLQAYINVPPRLLPAYACLAYLSSKDFHQEINDLEKFPLLPYAISYWHMHINTPQDVLESENLQRLLRQLLSPAHFSTWSWRVRATIENMPFHLWRRGRYFIPSAISDIALFYDCAWLTEVLLNDAVLGLENDFPMDCMSRAKDGEGNALRALLENSSGEKFPLEDAVTKTIAERWDRSLFELLLARRDKEVHITSDVVKAAARNSGSGKEVMALLLDKLGDKLQVTSDVIEAAARNSGSGKEVMALLLDKLGDKLQVTSDVIKAAAGNYGSGKEVMALLLDKQGSKIDITEEIVKLLAEKFDEEVLALLLDKRGDEAHITINVVKAAAGNYGSGKEVMALLLDKLGDKVQVTSDVIEAAARNSIPGR